MSMSNVNTCKLSYCPMLTILLSLTGNQWPRRPPAPTSSSCTLPPPPRTGSWPTPTSCSWCSPPATPCWTCTPASTLPWDTQLEPVQLQLLLRQLWCSQLTLSPSPWMHLSRPRSRPMQLWQVCVNVCHHSGECHTRGEKCHQWNWDWNGLWHYELCQVSFSVF